MEGERGQPSASEPSHYDLTQCTTWEEVKNLLLSRGVAETQLSYWELLWRWDELQAIPVPILEELDTAALKQQLNRFCLRVVGTREAYECRVPEREGRRGSLCGKVVGRLDRARSHVCSAHLGVRMFQCQGECGKDGW